MLDVKMEMLSFIKNCLLTFNYPLAHSMSDDELGEIFKVSNRCFLISWMLKLLDSAYEEFLEHSENDKDLGNFVYELGFCTQKEKLPFMTGELPVSQQVKVLFNMFTFITDVKNTNVEENMADVVTNSEVIALINVNLNLFPMYGDIRLRSTEKGLNSAKFNEEINEIKALILNKNENNPEHSIEHKFTDDIHIFIEKLREELPSMKFVMENMCKKKETKSRDVIKLQANSAEMLKNSRDNLNIISQFIKDVNTVEDFVKNELQLNEEEGAKNEDYYEMVNILYQDVSSAIKFVRRL